MTTNKLPIYSYNGQDVVILNEEDAKDFTPLAKGDRTNVYAVTEELRKYIEEEYIECVLTYDDYYNGGRYLGKEDIDYLDIVDIDSLEHIATDWVSLLFWEADQEYISEREKEREEYED